MRRFALAIALLLLACEARGGTLSSNIAEDLEVYSDKGAEAYLTALLKGGPLEGSKEAMSQVNMLRTIEGFYGSYVSFEAVREVNLGERSAIIYFILNYEQGPVFGRATGYRSGKDWSVVNFQFHTEAENIWPAPLLVGDG